MQLIPNPLVIPVGLMVGVLIAAPVGPVNVICIQRAIARGPIAGIAAGMGAVLGDGLIALMAALGVGAISGAITTYQNTIQFVGGLVLALFGLKLFFAKAYIVPPSKTDDEHWETIMDVIWDVPKTFFLTITNPGAVLGLVAIFGGVSSFVEVRTQADALFMVAAIMAGSAGWWVLLSTLIGRIRHRVDVLWLGKINRIAGVLLVGFGGLVVGELVVKWVAGRL